jgi:chromate transport protein ChrA
MWNWLWWFMAGCVTGCVLTYTFIRIKAKGITLHWHEWVLSGLALLILVFMTQTFLGSLAENEPRAAWMSLAFMGFTALVLIVINIRSVRSRFARNSA